MNPTGHAAIYFSRICAATPVSLRRCEPGETGAVISRYHRVGGHDWIAIPLIPVFHLLYRDFVRNIVDFYYPRAVHRNFTADVGIVTPKQAAKSLVHYSKKHPELASSDIVIAQVPGTIPRSRPGPSQSFRCSQPSRWFEKLAPRLPSPKACTGYRAPHPTKCAILRRLL